MKEKNSFCFIILILLLLLSFKSIEKTLKNIRLISYNSETWSKIANDKGFIQQFESYLQKVNKIEDLVYVINSNKANINEVKQAFKELFKRNSDEILEIMSPELKKSLGLINKNREEVFKLLIKDTNSPLYNFIKSQ